MITLAPQQYACVSLVARGLEDNEIAEVLGLSTGTVKVHLQAARKHTGARNRVILALMFERGEIAERPAILGNRYGLTRGDELRVMRGRLRGAVVRFRRVANSQLIYVETADGTRAMVTAKYAERVGAAA